MKLRTISATSLQAFEECPARWYAENSLYTPRAGGNGPANTGTACHYACEHYVQAVYVQKTHEPSLELLHMFYKIGFEEAFGSADFSIPEFKDGKDMLTNWWNRTDLSDVEILSTEKKDYIEIKTSDGIKRYNYIWDRCDLVVDENGRRIIRVVDYKSVRAYISSEDLKQKIQARMYAMGAAIQFKDQNIDEIWIVFDLFRYGDPIEVKFSWEENRETWKWIKKTAERILATDENNPPETLGPGCVWCVRKTTCETLRKNISGGGVFALLEGEDLLKARLELESVNKAAGYALREIDDLLVRQAQEQDVTELSEGLYDMKFTTRKTTVIDSEEAAMILGPVITAQIGKIGVTQVKELLKGDELTAAQKSQLKGIMRTSLGDPKPKVTKRSI